MTTGMDTIAHRQWLAAESARLVTFVESSVHDTAAPFTWLSTRGVAMRDRPVPLWLVARMVHCFSIEHLLGRADAGRLAAAGVEQLARFIDRKHGGFVAEMGPGDTVTSDGKELYGHAFALLAGISARRAGIDGADEIVAFATEAIDTHFWIRAEGAGIDAFDRTWRPVEEYRGQNANMHLVEAYLALFESDHDPIALDRARGIAERLIDQAARNHQWRIPEHFDAHWRVDPDYNSDRPTDQFRPFGTLVGHSFEWARLILNARALDPGMEWATDAAAALFDRAVRDGWDDVHGGFGYSVDFRGVPVNRSRMHWTVAEAIGAAVWLYRATGNDEYAQWYDRWWAHVDNVFIDRHDGSWWHELDAHNRPATATWDGKPDLYHAWQATLYSRVQGPRGIGDAAARGHLSG